MAYDIAARSVCQVTIRGTLFNQVVMNTFHYRLDGTSSLINGSLFLDNFSAVLTAPGNLIDAWEGVVPAQVINHFLDLQWIDLDRFVKKTYVVGTEGGSPLGTTSTNQAAVLELRADIADKRSISSKHIPGLGGSGIVAGQLSFDKTAEMSTVGEASVLPLTVGTRIMTPIIFGRARAAYTDKHGVVHPAIGKSYREVSQFIVQATARTMRRRTVGVGI